MRLMKVTFSVMTVITINNYYCYSLFCFIFVTVVKEKCDVNKSGASESTGNQGASEPSVVDNGGKKMNSGKLINHF